MGCLYKLTFPDGKAYIGITTGTATERFSEHVYWARKGRTYCVNAAIRKYGHDSVAYFGKDAS